MLERPMPVQFDNLSCGFTNVTSIIDEKTQRNLLIKRWKDDFQSNMCFCSISCNMLSRVDVHGEKNIDDWTISNVARMEFKKVKYNFLLFIHLE